MHAFLHTISVSGVGKLLEINISDWIKKWKVSIEKSRAGRFFSDLKPELRRNWLIFMRVEILKSATKTDLAIWIWKNMKSDLNIKLWYYATQSFFSLEKPVFGLKWIEHLTDKSFKFWILDCKIAKQAR